MSRQGGFRVWLSQFDIQVLGEFIEERGSITYKAPEPLVSRAVVPCGIVPEIRIMEVTPL